jgi:PqqD family protein of HPr-rel-A system
MEVSRRWRIPPGIGLIQRAWGEGEVVVYHAASGDTHLLDVPAARLLSRLQGSPATVHELCSVVAADLPFSPEEALDYTEELLDELQHLALVEPVCHEAR